MVGSHLGQRRSIDQALVLLSPLRKLLLFFTRRSEVGVGLHHRPALLAQFVARIGLVRLIAGRARRMVQAQFAQWFAEAATLLWLQ